jgi:hypothetical protein
MARNHARCPAGHVPYSWYWYYHEETRARVACRSGDLTCWEGPIGRGPSVREARAAAWAAWDEVMERREKEH